MSENNPTTRDNNELQHVLARLQGAQTLLSQARERAIHRQGDTSSNVLTEIETLLQELYLETSAMAAESSDRSDPTGDEQARPEYSLDSLLGLADAADPDRP